MLWCLCGQLSRLSALDDFSAGVRDRLTKPREVDAKTVKWINSLNQAKAAAGHPPGRSVCRTYGCLADPVVRSIPEVARHWRDQASHRDLPLLSHLMKHSVTEGLRWQVVSEVREAGLLQLIWC